MKTDITTTVCGAPVTVAIEQGVPVSRRGAWGRGAVVREMGVGDSIVVPREERTGYMAHAKPLRITLLSRRVRGSEPPAVRIWRTA